MKPSKQLIGGFTLLELMVVVCIVSVLAATAIPLLGRYILKSKVSEAYLNIRKIYDGEVVYYQEEHTNQGGSVISKQFVETLVVPPTAPTNDKRDGLWDQGNWPATHFSSDSSVYYSYLVDTYPDLSPFRPAWVPGWPDPPPTGATAAVLIRAYGDLDGDGKLSEFARIAKVAGSDIEGSGGVFSLDELE